MPYRRSTLRADHRLKIAGRTYRIVRACEQLIGSKGQDLEFRLDTDTARMILGPECQGEHAVFAICEMHLHAQRFERGEPAMPRSEARPVAAKVEYLIRDFGLQSEILEQVNQIVDGLDGKRKPIRWGLTSGVALVGTAIALALTFVFYQPAEQGLGAPQVAAPQFVVKPAKLPNEVKTDIVYGLDPYVIPFKPKASVVAAHPTEPGFVVVDEERNVYLARVPLQHTPLANLDAPAHWIHVSADGSEAVICDWSGTVTLVPLSLATPLVRYRPDREVIEAYALGAGRIIATSAKDGSSFSLGDTQGLPDDAFSAIPSTSAGNLLAFKRKHAYDQFLIVEHDGEHLLSRRLGKGQRLLSFDFCEQINTGVFLFNDATVAMYRRESSALELTNEIRHPSMEFGAAAQVQVSARGETAWIAGDRLERWDLHAFDRIADTEMIPGGPMVSARIHNQQELRVLLTTKNQGVAWK